MLLSVILAAAALASPSECWELKMKIAVPRVYDNAESRGYRKYQWQTVTGYFSVTPSADGREPYVEICSLLNKTHKVGGACVKYDAWAYDDSVLWHGIGSNRTGKFGTRSVKMRIVAEPSYAIGPEPTEDNSLDVVLSGCSAASPDKMKGSVAGQLGCGCAEYGHVSPTRIWGQDTAVDTAAVYGTWTANRVKSKTGAKKWTK